MYGGTAIGIGKPPTLGGGVSLASTVRCQSGIPLPVVMMRVRAYFSWVKIRLEVVKHGRFRLKTRQDGWLAARDDGASCEAEDIHWLRRYQCSHGVGVIVRLYIRHLAAISPTTAVPSIRWNVHMQTLGGRLTSPNSREWRCWAQRSASHTWHCT